MKSPVRKPFLCLTAKEKAILAAAQELPVLEYELLIKPLCKELYTEWLPDSVEYSNGIIVSRSGNYIKVYAGLYFSDVFYIFCNWACRFWIARSQQEITTIIAVEKKASADDIFFLNEANRAASLRNMVKQGGGIPKGLADIKWERLS